MPWFQTMMRRGSRQHKAFRTFDVVKRSEVINAMNREWRIRSRRRKPASGEKSKSVAMRSIKYCDGTSFQGNKVSYGTVA